MVSGSSPQIAPSCDDFESYAKIRRAGGGDGEERALQEVQYGWSITSQLPVAKWHEWIGDPTLADAILDRLVNNAYKLELKGHSRRRTTNIKKVN